MCAGSSTPSLPRRAGSTQRNQRLAEETEKKRLQGAQQFVQEAGEVVEAMEVGIGEGGEGLSEGFDAARASLAHEADAPWRSFEADPAAVLGGVTPDQPGALEAGNDAAHGGRPDLLGLGELTKGPGASSKDEDRECGELGRPHSAGEIANAQAAQEMNSGRVKLIGDSKGFGREPGLRAGSRGGDFALHDFDFLTVKTL